MSEQGPGAGKSGGVGEVRGVAQPAWWKSCASAPREERFQKIFRAPQARAQRSGVPFYLQYSKRYYVKLNVQGSIARNSPRLAVWSLMARTYIAETTVDDLMRAVIEEIQRHGERISPTKGDAVELTGVLLELTNPRARLSQTETRGKPYSCLGELCWYLAKTNDLAFIFYYLPQYKKFADGDEIFGGYGPRLFNWKGTDQFSNVISLLRRNPDSRKAVIQLFDAQDIVAKHADVPCTCTMQFMLRGDSLHMFTNMRSNDALWGVAHDFFCFTMLQEIVARDLGVELGTYKHAVGSLHLYDESIEAAKRFLAEGWQSTEATMPAMPTGNPWPGIGVLLKAENIIRSGGTFDSALLSGTDPYWADLIRMLQILRYKKEKDPVRINQVRAEMSSKTYAPFIDKTLSRLE